MYLLSNLKAPFNFLKLTKARIIPNQKLLISNIYLLKTYTAIAIRTAVLISPFIFAFSKLKDLLLGFRAYTMIPFVKLTTYHSYFLSDLFNKLFKLGAFASFLSFCY